MFSDSAPLLLVLLEPIASISSINTIHGDNFLALSNSFLTLDAPSPANISINSDPLIDINGTSASPAIAFAINVFPVPGFPYNKIPFGIFAPISANLFGLFKNSTISFNSSFSSSNPAISSNVTFVFLSVSSYTSPLSPSPCILNIITNNATIINVGKIENIYDGIFDNTLGFLISTLILLSSNTFCCTNSVNTCVLGIIALFSFSTSFIFTFKDVLPVVISIFSTFPA